MNVGALAALRDDIRAAAKECRASAGVPCQSEYSWHADAYDEWADRLDALLRVPPPSVDRDLLIRADSYLSLLWHRHTPSHIKADVELAMAVERTIGELRNAYKASGGREDVRR